MFVINFVSAGQAAGPAAAAAAPAPASAKSKSSSLFFLSNI